MASVAAGKIQETSDAPITFDLDSLISLETLDRASPDLWPEQTPGLGELACTSADLPPAQWEQGLTPEDLAMLHHFGSLTLPTLIIEVRKLYETAYQLGLEESKEMTRGKYLNILNRDRRQ